MKKFLIQLSMFSIPILLCWPFLFLFEPFNFYLASKIFDKNPNFEVINKIYNEYIDKTKFGKILEFQYSPCKNIIIGDSQSLYINEELINEISGIKTCNLSLSGANPETKFSVFWFAAEQTKLNHVTIQLSFENWNMNQNSFKYEQDYHEKPLLNLLYMAIKKDLHQKLMNNFNKYGSSIVPYTLKFPITKYKNEVLNDFLKEKYKNYNYPDKKIVELKKIVDYCRENKVSIDFVIFPFYQRYFDYLTNHDLIKYNDRFKKGLNLLAKTYDYSSIKNVNSRDENFLGYFHQNQFITDSLTHLVWGKKSDN